jgi:hypothetical protein
VFLYLSNSFKPLAVKRELGQDSIPAGAVSFVKDLVVFSPSTATNKIEKQKNETSLSPCEGIQQASRKEPGDYP